MEPETMVMLTPAGIDKLAKHDPQHVATYLVLLAFEALGEDSPILADLTRSLGLSSPSTVVRRLQGMERAGLITREQWPNARRIRYGLTLETA